MKKLLDFLKTMLYNRKAYSLWAAWSLKIEQLENEKTLKSVVLVKHIEKKLKSKKKLDWDSSEKGFKSQGI